MIPYDELERALARWQTRRSSAGSGSEAVSESAKPQPIEEGTRTPMSPDQTGEIDLADAVVEEG